MSGWAIQQALYSALTGHAGLTALVPVSSIVDFGPRVDDAAGIFPYVSFGSFVLADYDTDNTTGFDAAFRIHSYSDKGSSKECRQIQDAIYDALHLAEFPVSGYNTVIIYREDTDISQTSRGAFHGRCEYRCLLEKL